MRLRLALATSVISMALALVPSGAAAATSKTVKLRLPSDGNATLAQFSVKVRARGRAATPKLRVKSKRRFGDGDIAGVVTRTRGNTFKVTLVATNPATGTARSAQAGGEARVTIRGVGTITVKQLEAVQDVLDEGTVADYEDLCEDKQLRKSLRRLLKLRAGLTGAQARRLVNALVTYLCVDATPAALGSAHATLVDLGMTSVPGCYGRVEDFPGNRAELVILLYCHVAARQLLFSAQQGNNGVNCLGPPGSQCGAGQAQCGRAEGVCFFNFNGFAQDVLLRFNARWALEVVRRRAYAQVLGFYLATFGGQLRPIYLHAD